MLNQTISASPEETFSQAKPPKTFAKPEIKKEKPEPKKEVVEEVPVQPENG